MNLDPNIPPHGPSIWVVDDDTQTRQLLALYLGDAGMAPRCFADAESCLACLDKEPVDIILTDLHMPGMGGLGFLKEIKARSASCEVIVITGHADKQTAIKALRLGAYDFFEKPVDADELKETIRRTARYQRTVAERDLLAEQLSLVSGQEASHWGIDALIGRSEPMRQVIEHIRLVQRSAGTPVLVTGESGTGKELVARAIHFGSSRAGKPFVPVNCSAIPSELAESMLFGHTKGSFTGAVADRKGCFETAHGGTVFLDELGDMPLAVQIKLLRVLEDGVVVPVGRTEGRKVDARVIAATNADLHTRIAEKHFRIDLYYRLAGYTIHLPALRDRPGDIPMLAEHFCRLLSTEMGMRPCTISPPAVTALQQHPFPGNVRELKNTIERALLRCGGEPIKPEHLNFLPAPGFPAPTPPPTAGMSAAPSGGDLPLDLAQAEQILIERALEQTDGNVTAAARLLGINRTKLYRRMATRA